MNKQIITFLMISFISIQMINSQHVIDFDTLMELNKRSQKRYNSFDKLPDMFKGTLDFLLPCVTGPSANKKWSIKVNGAEVIYDEFVDFNLDKIDAKIPNIECYCRTTFKITNSEIGVVASSYKQDRNRMPIPTHYGFKAFSSRE